MFYLLLSPFTNLPYIVIRTFVYSLVRSMHKSCALHIVECVEYIECRPHHIAVHIKNILFNFVFIIYHTHTRSSSSSVFFCVVLAVVLHFNSHHANKWAAVLCKQTVTVATATISKEALKHPNYVNIVVEQTQSSLKHIYIYT